MRRLIRALDYYLNHAFAWRLAWLKAGSELG